jgi:hypothetical protein
VSLSAPGFDHVRPGVGPSLWQIVDRHGHDHDHGITDFGADEFSTRERSTLP